MTCYERLRQKNQVRYYPRLESYFNALENNQLDEYHKKHGRGKIK